MPPTYIDANSRRTRSVILFRSNKLVIAIELLLVIALICSLQILKLVPLISVFLIIMVLLWLRGDNWMTMGLGRPTSWRRTIFLGVGLGILITLIQSVVIIPIIGHFIHTEPDVRVFAGVHDNILLLLASLITTWTSAAFAEEMIFRGYLMNRLNDLFEKPTQGWPIALFGQAIVFGIAHTYQGLAGMITVGAVGLLMGLVYLTTKKNLWVCAILHGILDTGFFLAAFAGL